MTTKQAAPAAEAAPAMPDVPAKPFSINIGAPMDAAFNEMILHARQGYTLSDGPIQITPTGWAWFTLVQGSPKEYIINAAKQSIERSQQEEAAAYKRDVEAAAKRLLEDEKRKQLEKDVASATAKLEREIAALKQAAQAELAKLN